MRSPTGILTTRRPEERRGLRRSTCAGCPRSSSTATWRGRCARQTVADLARKHDIALPTDDVDRIYDYETIYEFLEIFRLVNSTVIDRDDFARIAYESLEDGVKLGNLKYREMFFNPTLHTIRGVPMATVIDGLDRRLRGGRSRLRRAVPPHRRRVPPGPAGRWRCR